MSIARFSIGKRGSSAANAAYVTSEKSAEHISFFNLNHLEADTKFEARSNAVAYANARQIRERKTRKDARTHYQLILSWHGREKTEIAVNEAHNFLNNNFPKVYAILGVHQDSDNTHVHVWIDARQIDKKKLQLNKDRFRTIDEKWAEHYDRLYQTSHLEDYKLKKEETEKFKQSMYDVRRDMGDAIANLVALNKPERASDRFRKAYFRDKGAKYLTDVIVVDDPAGTGDPGSVSAASTEHKSVDTQATKEQSHPVSEKKGTEPGEQKREAKNDAVQLTTERQSKKPIKKEVAPQETEGAEIDSNTPRVEAINNSPRKKKTKKNRQPENEKNNKKSNTVENNDDSVRQLDKLNGLDSPFDQLAAKQKQRSKPPEPVPVAKISKVETEPELKPTRIDENTHRHTITKEQPDEIKQIRHESVAKTDSTAKPAKPSLDSLREMNDTNVLKPSVPNGEDADKYGDLLVTEAKISKAAFLLNKAKKDEPTRKHTITVEHPNGAKITQKVSLKILAVQKRTYASYTLNRASENGVIDSNAKIDGVSKTNVAKQIYFEAQKEMTEFQKPWKDEILKRNTQIIDRIKDAHLNVSKNYKRLQSETANFPKDIRPSPKRLWEAQLIAADSNNPELFSKLQKFHEEMNISRIDPGYARLRGQNTLLHLLNRQNEKQSELAKPSQKVIITVRRDEGTSEYRIEGTRSAEVEVETVKEERDVNRNNAFMVSHDLLKSFSISGKKPKKITGSLSWFTSSRPENRVVFNPIEEIKKDPSIQFIQAAHSFVKDFTETQKEGRAIDQKFEEENKPTNQANDYVKLGAEIQSATLQEESIRRGTNLADPNGEVANLTPNPRFNKEELEQMAIAAEELRENNFTESYKTILKTNKNLSSELDETIRRNASKSFLKAARASNLANTAIENITEISDNELEITLDATLVDQTNDLLECAVYSDKIAFDLSEGNPVEFGPSVEDTESIVRYLEDTTSTLNEFLENQIRDQAQDVLATYDPPSEQDKAVFESLQFNDEAQARFDLHERSERQAAELYKKAEQAQDLAQPSMENHQNFDTYGSHEEADAKRAKSLQEDRAALDKQIDEDRIAGMSDEEIEKYREFEIKKAEFLEAEEAAKDSEDDLVRG